jgi:uncharacterized protein (TIGR02266 family)
MADERRSARRARLSGVRITYESASGERLEADALDLSRSGLFVRTAKPLGVGKRIALEIQVLGQPGPWSALGRVVWTRDSGDGDRPPGMGVKLIDVDDGVVATMDRLVETREPTEPGVGGPSKPAHLEMPSRRRDVSIPIDLVARKKDSASERPPAASATVAAAASPAAARRGGYGWLVVLGVLAAVAGVAGYVLFDGLFRPPPQVAPIPSVHPPAMTRPAVSSGAAAPPPPSETSATEPTPAVITPPPVTAPTGSANVAPPAGTASKKPTAPSTVAAPGRLPGTTPKRPDNPY